MSLHHKRKNNVSKTVLFTCHIVTTASPPQKHPRINLFFWSKCRKKTENSGKHEVDLLLDAFNCNTLFSNSVTHSYLCILETASSESDIQRGANEKLSRINGSTQRG